MQFNGLNRLEGIYDASSSRIQSLIAELEKRDPHSKRFLSRSTYLAESMGKSKWEPLITRLVLSRRSCIERKALAFANLIKRMEIRIPDGELIVGYYPREEPDEVDMEGIKEAENLLGQYSIHQRFKEKRTEFSSKMGSAGNPFTWRVAHVIVDYPKALKLGLDGLLSEVESKLHSTADSDAKDFYQACLICLDAAKNFALRYSDLAQALGRDAEESQRASELAEISRICRKVSSEPPQTFWEALQLLWFLHLWVYLEAPGAGNSLGRFDQYMIDFYEKDISGGRCTHLPVSRDFQLDALELLKCFFIKINELGYGHSSQNLTVAGLLTDGKDGTNMLTYLSLKATREIHLRLPHLSVRVHRSTPDELLEQVVETVAEGIGQPQLYNDEVVIPSLVNQGIPRPLAVNYAIQGCIQIYLPGISAPWSDVFLNLGKCLELALNNGRSFADESKISSESDAVENLGRLFSEKTAVGPKTGWPEVFEDFEDVYQAFLTQIRYFLSVMGESRDQFDRLLPEVEAVPFASILIGDCLDRGLDAYDSGGRYKLSGIYLVGIATVADSLAVILEIMEGENRLGVTLTDFVSELKANFGSNRKLRESALSIPKYGNDIDDVDSLTVRVTSDLCNEVLLLSSPDGTLTWPILSSYIQNVKHGHVTSATPDGRLAGEPLSNTISPSFGQDKFGPTAIIKSACKIDFDRAVGGAVLNLKFPPSLLRNQEGKESLQGLLRTYVNLGGRQIQINCIDNETLRDAQDNPSKYPNLLVRVSGFCGNELPYYKPVISGE